MGVTTTVPVPGLLCAGDSVLVPSHPSAKLGQLTAWGNSGLYWVKLGIKGLETGNGRTGNFRISARGSAPPGLSPGCRFQRPEPKIR